MACVWHFWSGMDSSPVIDFLPYWGEKEQTVNNPIFFFYLEVLGKLAFRKLLVCAKKGFEMEISL